MSSNSRRSSLSNSPQHGGSSQDLKHRVITCLNKLSDRDTLAMAANELDSIARTLTTDSFSPFLTCIHNTDASTKPPVRKQCVNLLTLLSNSHGEALAPFLSKMISTVVRRLRDPDSSVRSACVDAVTAMSSQITKPPFSVAFLKPLMENLSLEQDLNSQIGSALCLAAAIEAAPELDVAQLRKSLPRLGKLAKSEVFKAKAALLVLIGSIVGAGGASSRGVLEWLIPSVVEFLSSEDWAVRKAATEALGKVAEADRDLASHYKMSCLSALESRRFDKVKVVRETMNRTLDLWKKVDAGDLYEASSQTNSRSSIDNGIGRCFSSPISKSLNDSGFKTPPPKKTVPTNRSPPSDVSLVNSIKKLSPPKSANRSSSTSKSSELDYPKRPSDWKIEIAAPSLPSLKAVCEVGKSNFVVSESEENEQCGKPKLENNHVLVSNSREDKVHKFGGLRSGSRVVPFDDDEIKDGPGVVDSSAAEEAYEDQKEVEDLSRIREQLLQIENQQSSLLHLLQRFIGSSQNGLNSLESRVHGLEMALDEISYDLALTNGRIPNSNSAENNCCKLPGAEFLSSKFWRRAEVGRYNTTARFSSSGMASSLNREASAETYKLEGYRFQHQNGGAFVHNQLADVQSGPRSSVGGLPSRMPKNIIQDAKSMQVWGGNGLDGA